MAANEESAEATRHRQLAKKALYVSGFLSVAQHVVTVQSEVMLIKDLVNGNSAIAAKLLANTLGLVGILGIVVNQIGGKLSDSFGRKPFLMLGPAANIVLGGLVFRNFKNRALVLSLRVLRQILTTFSSSVMLQSALADIMSGPQLGMALSEVGAIVGMGVVTTPMLETFVLQNTSGPKFSYLALSALGFIHTLWNGLMTPETLERAKRKSADAAFTLATLNPFGFLNIFRRGSVALQKMVTITTLQLFLEGKNLSDLVEFWKRDHLKWSVEQSRNFVMLYGALCIAAGAKITPMFLKSLSARSFTSVTNFTNMVGFFLRGSMERTWVFILAMPFLLPGVNGASGTALKALLTDRANAEGFGKGEFSAWSNNLRALAGASATVLFGNYYAWTKTNGMPSGSVFALAAIIGTIMPEVLLRFTRDDELKPSAIEN